MFVTDDDGNLVNIGNANFIFAERGYVRAAFGQRMNENVVTIATLPNESLAKNYVTTLAEKLLRER